MLTEDDYLEFLVDVNLGRGDDKRDSVPAQVRKALSSDLLVLGFSLNSWAFRALYTGLIKSDDRGPRSAAFACSCPPARPKRPTCTITSSARPASRWIWRTLSEYAAGLRSI